MTLSVLRLVLGAWVIAVVVPGTVVAIGSHPEADAGGVIGLVWTLGFLAQLGLFVAVTVRGGNDMHAFAILAASLLPWVVDWSTPWALWAAIPCTFVAVFAAWTIYAPAEEAQHLVDDGVPATGVVLEVIKPKLFNTVVNNVYIKRKVRLRVERSDGVAPYEIVHSGLFMLGLTPDEGDVMALLVDPDDPQHVEVAKDAATHAGLRRHAAGSHAPAPLTDQLERLARLHTSGKLTDDEYSRAKTTVLG